MAPVVDEAPLSSADVTLHPGTPAAAVACCEPDDGDAAGLSAAEATTVAAVLKALADPVRLRLYSRITAAAEPVCVCDIDDVGVSQPTVSHHLRKLREAGLIASERRGTWVYYSPVPGATAAVRAVL
ncbi:winged helix-turn-helix transcriptional regulator [Nocardioides sp. ChNu-153]|uniref:ArsR/SmtB family transcription factor n=1 Tax=unclassified Nocardioides TaxID=2615069 RepID=UPI002405DB8E|nr:MULTISPECIES: metalloregulator ArsR/SmtB family transcription factor [unclassified Nocardioides]MDF9717968.1 metalloregulator ArsR/SmtB family transcription factor [Nocardioides sp. ChNu-99]MDN7121625.1 winged helix-turn-helix transcriptional regulator [Nocardioides sp. ChNu-153]